MSSAHYADLTFQIIGSTELKTFHLSISSHIYKVHVGMKMF